MNKFEFGYFFCAKKKVSGISSKQPLYDFNHQLKQLPKTHQLPVCLTKMALSYVFQAVGRLVVKLEVTVK